MNTKPPLSAASPDERPREHFPYLRFLLLLGVSIFLAEIASMIAIYRLPNLRYEMRAVLDAGIVVILISPVLYFLSFRPLIRYLEKRQKAETSIQAERQRFNNILETLPGYLVLLAPDYHVPFANRFFRERFGEAQGRRCYEYLFGRDEPCEVCDTYKVLKTLQPGRWEWTGPDNHIYDVYDFPFTDTDGTTLILEMGIDITEQKQAAAQISEMAFFPALNPDAVLQVDASGQVRKINPAAARMGFSVGAHLAEIVPSLGEIDLQACITAGLTQHIQREAPLGERVLLWSVRGAPDLGLAFLYSKDITQHRRTEAAVRQLSRIVEQTEDTVAVTNREGVIEYVNPAFERLTGYTKEETLGSTPRVIKSDFHSREFYQNLWNTILAGEVFQSEIANRKKNGEIYYEVKTITPLRDAQGNITHFVATGKNITEHKLDEEKLHKAYDELELRVQERTEELKIANSELQTEIAERKQVEETLRKANLRLQDQAEELDAQAEELRLQTEELRDANEQLSQSESTLQSILNATQESIWLFSPDGVVLLANTTALARLKAPAAEIIGQPFSKFMPADIAQPRQACLDQVTETGQPVELEDERGGITFHHNFYPVTDTAGHVTGIVAFSRDISERKRAQAREGQLSRTLKALSHSNQAMLRSRSEDELLDEVCKVIIEDCGHAMVWIGFKEEDEGKSVRPVASAGFEAGYLENMRITWADNDRGRGPTGTAVRTGESRRCRNMLTDPQFAPWRAQALQRGYSSSIALPLKAQENVLGAVTIYSRQPDSFSDEEERLLAELAGDLAYGIMAIRLRAAHAQAEAALQRSEALLNQTGEMAKIGGWELDVQTMTLLWSRETYRIHEVDMSLQPSVENAIDFYAPEVRPVIGEAVARAINEGQPYDLELPFITAQGRRLWIRTMGYAEFRDGRCARLFGAFQDITERKHVENALRESENKFSTLFGKASMPAVLSRFPDHAFIDVNEAWAEAFGYTKEELIGKTSIELGINRNTERRVSLINTIQQYTPVRNVEQTLYTKSGEARIVLTNVNAITIGGQDYALASFQDITERKRAEEALQNLNSELEVRVRERTKKLHALNKDLLKEINERKEVEQQLRIRTTAMEAAANGIIITDPQGNIQWANPALTQISGYEAQDLIGQSTHVFSSGQHDRAYYHQLWDTILAGNVWRGEVTNRRKDGTLYIEEETITPVPDENGQIPHFIAVKQDITQRKQAEEELERRNRELQIISEAEHKQRQLSEALVQAALILNKSLKLDEVLVLILGQIKEVIPYRLADIALLEGETFYDACHQGDLEWSVSNSRFLRESFPLIHKVHPSGKPILIPDTEKEANWVVAAGAEVIHSFLCAPLLIEEKAIGFVNLFSDEPGFFTEEMSNRLVAFAAHAAVAIQNAWLFEQVRASSERLQSLSRRLVEIQENERLYIARELHDEAGQMLTSLMLDLVTLESEADRPEAVLKTTAAMEKMLGAVSENLHNVAMALRPASLDHLGLVPALRQYVESVGERYKLRASFTAGNFHERLPASMETEIYRIVQEALTNVARHAHASQVDVILTVRGHKLIIMVEDDGQGFDPEKVPDTGHLGLFGMHERAEMIGGQLVIESKCGKGTTVMVEVDYDSPVIDRR